MLTRFIASDYVADRRHELLLEKIGAPTMSGGPVFIERGENLMLLGLYTGAIYPDSPLGSEKATALGAIANLGLVFCGHLPFVSRPSEPVEQGAPPSR